MKKLLLLGGSRYLLPVIKTAHEMGCYVITCDYLPDNIAHKYSDDYCNVSIIDKEAVLEMAAHLQIDGIMSFACDPGVVTAAYVAEKLGLPSSGPYESVRILQNKGKFRDFLREHGFNVPMAKSYKNIYNATADREKFRWPIIVKPVDSAGSKGVTRLDNPDNLCDSVEYALSFSSSKEFIIEEFIEKKGFSSDSDCFSVNGEMKYVSFSRQWFDEQAGNPYTPAGFSWPSTLELLKQQELSRELQRLIKLLGMGTSLYNVETREGTDGKVYIMEVSPRGGGNRLSEMLRYVDGVDLITNAIKAALGEPVGSLEKGENCGIWAEIILHSNKKGVFNSLWIAEEMEKYIVERDLWVKKGQEINLFSAANESIGTLILKFSDEKTMLDAMKDTTNWLKINMDGNNIFQ